VKINSQGSSRNHTAMGQLEPSKFVAVEAIIRDSWNIVTEYIAKTRSS
jgi:hypothetical protein